MKFEDVLEKSKLIFSKPLEGIKNIYNDFRGFINRIKDYCEEQIGKTKDLKERMGNYIKVSLVSAAALGGFFATSMLGLGLSSVVVRLFPAAKTMLLWGVAITSPLGGILSGIFVGNKVKLNESNDSNFFRKYLKTSLLSLATIVVSAATLGLGVGMISALGTLFPATTTLGALFSGLSTVIAWGTLVAVPSVSIASGILVSNYVDNEDIENLNEEDYEIVEELSNEEIEISNIKEENRDKVEPSDNGIEVYDIKEESRDIESDYSDRETDSEMDICDNGLNQGGILKVLNYFIGDRESVIDEKGKSVEYVLVNDDTVENKVSTSMNNDTIENEYVLVNNDIVENKASTSMNNDTIENEYVLVNNENKASTSENNNTRENSVPNVEIENCAKKQNKTVLEKVYFSVLKGMEHLLARV